MVIPPFKDFIRNLHVQAAAFVGAAFPVLFTPYGFSDWQYYALMVCSGLSIALAYRGGHFEGFKTKVLFAMDERFGGIEQAADQMMESMRQHTAARAEAAKKAADAIERACRESAETKASANVVDVEGVETKEK